VESKPDYKIHTDIKFGPLEHIDVLGLAEACNEEWFNQTLCRVNDCVVRLGVLKGEFHWHKHDLEDEFFYVVKGRLLVDLEAGTTDLEVGQGMMVPRGVIHRTRAPDGVVVLMIEAASVTPTGD
jgi:mannose-6-phosphate isomerase-like protein (cupin superfamily)